MLKELIFVTSNENKLREAREILGIDIQSAKIDLDEIQSLNLEDILIHKVNQAHQLIQKPVMVEDVGFFITAWGGFPGPLVKFLLQAGGNDLLIKMLANFPDRSTTIKAGIGFHDGQAAHTFIAEIKGQVSSEPRGQNGFGWDTIFIPE